MTAEAEGLGDKFTYFVVNIITSLLFESSEQDHGLKRDTLDKLSRHLTTSVERLTPSSAPKWKLYRRIKMAKAKRQ